MTSFLSPREIKRGYRMEPRSRIPTAIFPDGLLIAFLRADGEAFMDAHYPSRGAGDAKVWFFNNTYDREIAEIDGDRIIANPRVLWDHLMVSTAGKER